MLDYAGIWCTSCFSFSLVGWLLLLLDVATQVIEPWARSGSNWSNAQLPQLANVEISPAVGCLRFIDWGVFRSLFVSSRQLDFTIFIKQNWIYKVVFQKQKKIQQQHQGPMKHPLHLLAFSDTVWPRPCLERPLLRRLDGMAFRIFLPGWTSVKYFWANLQLMSLWHLYKFHLLQSFPPS